MKPITLISTSILVACCLIPGTMGCKQSYDPPAIANPRILLVVEGFINNGPDSTNFSLTHTYALGDTSQTTPELGAVVTVEGQDNSSFSLAETGNGNYGAPLSLNNSVTYRLHIRTTGGKEYASDYVALKTSPPIDSINWTQGGNGVQLYVNTHDPQNNTRYYRWDYQETWEFHSSFNTNLEFVNDSVKTLSGVDTAFQCWRGDASSSIILGSSAQLAQDVIYRTPVVLVPSNTQQLSVEYSIQVRQYALSQAAYTWWQTMQKNTEQIGTIFGVQPTANTGNLHNLADSTEVVVGYVAGGTLQKQRIFISHQQVEPWDYETGCTLLNTSPDSVAYYYSIGLLLVDEDLGASIRYDLAEKFCVDCLLTGSNKKPSFWP